MRISNQSSNVITISYSLDCELLFRSKLVGSLRNFGSLFYLGSLSEAGSLEIIGRLRHTGSLFCLGSLSEAGSLLCIESIKRAGYASAATFFLRPRFPLTFKGFKKLSAALYPSWFKC